MTSGGANSIFWVDGTNYPLTAAGLQNAINDAEALPGDSTVAGGGVVIVTRPLALGATTINVGFTGATSGNNDGKPVTLLLWFYGAITTGANPGFNLATRSSMQGLNSRHTRITSTSAGPVIQITSPAENGAITNLRIEGGAQAIKGRGNAATTDVPGWLLEDLFLESQTGNAIELTSMSGRFHINRVFTNASGGAALRIGVFNNGETLPGTNENAAVTNSFFQNCGTKGIWVEADHFTATQQMVSTVFDNIQISTPAHDAFWFKMISPGGVSVRNLQIFDNPSAANRYDGVHVENVFGKLRGFSLTGLFGNGTQFKYAVNMNCTGQCVVDNAQMNGQTAAYLLAGDVRLSNSPYPAAAGATASATFAEQLPITFTKLLQVQRLRASQGTALLAADFTLSAGWGTTSTVTSVTGTDQAWQITVNSSGTGQAANPTITLSFHDGTWTNAPITVSKMVGGSGIVTALTEAPTDTTNEITFQGTPVAGKTYIISSIAMGR
ncbi:MAG: hypothetical protein GZ088_07795 [Acidipila sp.]|nr:hypothetical protein [Acidipila sp.]